MLTARELAASLSVLRALRTPVCASTLLTWGPDETRAYIGLARMGYVETREERTPSKNSAPFRWDRIAATPAGLEYLRQIEAANASLVAEVRRAA